MLKMLGEQI